MAHRAESSPGPNALDTELTHSHQIGQDQKSRRKWPIADVAPRQGATTATASEVTLRNHWRDTLTDSLGAEIRGIEERGPRVVRVLNLLAEDDYNSAIDWSRLARSWPVLRQRFQRSHGREALDNVGVWLRQAVTQPLSLAALRADVDYEDPHFARGDRCRFVSVE